MKIATVTADNLHVRSIAHEDGPVIAVLKKDEKVPVLDSKTFGGRHTWLKVKLPGNVEGWLYAKYVKVTSNVPDVEPPHVPVPDTDLNIWKWVLGGAAVVAVFLIYAFK
jgi:uncharacterized protein YgiM (DUF1202 family)